MGPTWPFLLMHRSHDMRHTSFMQVDGGQRDPWDRGVTTLRQTKGFHVLHVGIHCH